MTDELRAAAGYKFNDLTKPDPITPLGGAWWRAPEAEMHMHVSAVVRRIEVDQDRRMLEAVRYARLYSARDYVAFGSQRYQRAVAQAPTSPATLKLNVVRACISTVGAKIAKNRPRALFLTDGGDHELQEATKKCTQYCDGLFSATNVYAIGQQCFTDSEVFGLGAIEVFEQEDEIRCERVLYDELRVDEEDGKRGDPRQIHRVLPAQRDVLLALFGTDEKKAAAIRAAPAIPTAPGSSTVADLVLITKSWHLRSSKTSDDGLYAITIEGCTLATRKWEHDYFPILFLRWDLALTGFYGTGLAEELASVQLAINRILRRIDEGLEGAIPRVFLNGAGQVNRAQITDELWSIISYNGSAPPTFSPTSAFPPEVYQFLWQLWAKAFEVSGVSQLSATGKKPSGLDSGVALREYQDIETERFVLVGQRWEAWFMKIARVMLDMTRDLAKRNKKLSIKVRDGDHVNTLQWLRDVNLEEDQYLLDVWPTSGLPQAPAGRLAFVGELRKQGFLKSDELAMQVLNYPDLQQVLTLETAALANVRKTIQDILDKGQYSEPNKYQPLALGIRLAHASLLDGRNNGRPAERLDLLEQWIEAADALLTQLTPAPPPQAMGPGMPGPGGPGPEGGPPPGAPPGPEGMPIAA